MTPQFSPKFLFLVALAVVGPVNGFGQVPETQAPDFGVKVTYETKASTLKKVIAELAQQTKTPIAVSKPMEQEIVCISVHDVTAKVLMEKLALATAGQWSVEGGVYYLTASTSARGELRNQQIAARTKEFAKRIEGLAPKPVKPGQGEATGRRNAWAAQREDPVFYRILKLIGPSQLATVPAGKRIVLSTNANSKQYPLPDGAFDEILAFVHRNNLRAAEKPVAKPTSDEEGDFPSPENSGLPAIKERPSKALLILREESFLGGGMSLQLKLYGAKGNLLTRTDSMLGSSMLDSMLSSQSDAVPAEGAVQNAAATDTGGPVKIDAGPPPLTGFFAKAGKFKPSDDTRAFVQYMKNFSVGSSPTPDAKMSPAVEAEAKRKLLHPEEYDPLYYANDVLVGLARLNNEQLVALVPDDFFMAALTIVAEPVAAGNAAMFLSQANITFKEADGWCVGTPTNPDEAQAARMDRVKVGKLIRDFAGKQHLSLDEMARLALTGFDSINFSLQSMWLMFSSPSLIQGAFSNDWNLLKLYGLLNQSQRQVLDATGRIQIGTLDDAQRAVLDEAVYNNRNEALSIDVPTDTESVTGAASADIQQMVEGSDDDFDFNTQPQDYREEPTEAAPNGIPGQAFLTVKSKTKTVLQPEKDPNDQKPDLMMMYGNEGMSAEELAQMVVMGEQPNMAQYAMNVKTVKVGSRETFNFRIYVANGVFRTGLLRSAHFASDSPSYSLTGLPARLQKILDKCLADARKMYKDGQIDQGAPTTGTGEAGPPR